ncbi:hypothetical protein LDG_5569 [Legionella drancourtii LLAP12]|uniref:Uncharacterized protein n=1 Tax=Legionella drancourtii LLAP12 TaxID=658187 RepID=G9EK46_9GAMM|nr:hypothetical protein LDG_5569 [Legionella drancourtii LLAP12]
MCIGCKTLCIFSVVANASEFSKVFGTGFLLFHLGADYKFVYLKLM